jgi:citrate synthase
MVTTEKATPGGLEGVVAAETVLSLVDGERGRLVLRGHELDDLADAEFEDVAALLWRGQLPDAAGRESRRADLARGRTAAFARLGTLGDALDRDDGMDALRASLAHLPSDTSPAEGSAAALQESQSARLTGAVAVYAAAWWRRSQGREPLAPDGSLSHAADYLRMMQGERPSRDAERALGSYLVTVADHGMNASTFAARVVASTGSDAVSAVVAAVGALKGPLHGGAPGPVLDMLDAIRSPENTRPWLESEDAAGRRIMGMGHRVYRVRDPRAAVLERAIEKLDRAGAARGRLALARAVENEATRFLAERHPQRSLRANVEFYTAVLLESLGISRRLFSPTFAVGRVVGWCAHIDEQRRAGRLIRPASRYIGIDPKATG